MATHRYIDRICAAAAVLALAVTLLFVNGEALGLKSSGRVLGYENRLFDTSRVHTLDIVIDDWDAFLATCTSETYSPCAVVIDGEAWKNVGIRGKGNNSLSSVSQMDSSRYSFKVEFDQYESGKSYYGLDKLSLNNLIQDNTMMKDYLVYQMMGAFGVDSPLCSFVYLTVNGEDWGLYLAVEGVEDAFLQRNYGSEQGALYKPDSSGLGGGRGNGRDFDPEQMAQQWGNLSQSGEAGPQGGGDRIQNGAGQGPDGENLPQGGELGFPGGAAGRPNGENPLQGGQFGFPGGEDRVQRDTEGALSGGQQDGSLENGGPAVSFGGQNPGGGMSSADVKLQYIDDDPDSYPNIFDNAKTEVTQSDQRRLIASLKSLSAYEDLEQVLDMEKVLRYFVVHNFVVNGDSYTGSIVHNYYLYEEEGRLSMIPWDYNLAFGTFQRGAASSSVNEAIDDVLSDRPMQAWIFSDESYTQQYHQLYEEFLNGLDLETMIDQTSALIAPYVERDPTKFCTYEEFETGVEALKTFCALRTQSVRGQLEGTIPSTSQGQQENGHALVDVGSLDLSAMGTMNMGGGRGGFGGASDSNTDDGEAVPAFGPQQGGRGGMPGEGEMTAPGGDSSRTAPLLLAVSAAVLAIGLAIAFKFRR